MIELPRRSVTRFFIPLIDVLTLMFCIFLLMPLVKPTDEGTDAGSSFVTGAQNSAAAAQLARDRQELIRLRRERGEWRDLQRLRKESADLEKRIDQLKNEKIETLERRLAIRVLEIGEDGKLFYYDPRRADERRREITQDIVGQFIAEQKRSAGKDDLYFLLLYPRPASGNPAYPLRSQREEYDRWFAGIAHGYDVR